LTRYQKKGLNLVFLSLRVCSVTHGTARELHRCCPDSRCLHHTSSAPGCSGCSYKQTLLAGTEEGVHKTGWLWRRRRGINRMWERGREGCKRKQDAIWKSCNRRKMEGLCGKVQLQEHLKPFVKSHHTPTRRPAVIAKQIITYPDKTVLTFT